MVQAQEILVILLVALVVLGPKRLPDMARKIGGWANEVRKAAHDIRVGLEAEVGDLTQVTEEFKAPLKDVSGVMADTRKMVDDAAHPTRWVGPQPTSGPTPADAMSDLAAIEERGEALDDAPDAPDDEAAAGR